MDTREFVETLVTEVAPNATVGGFEERDARCRITLAGTTGVLVDCEIPRAVLERAERFGTERVRVAAALRRCADDVVALVPDGRGKGAWAVIIRAPRAAARRGGGTPRR